MAAGTVSLQRLDGFAYLTLDNPRVRNRLSSEMALHLKGLCEQLRQDPEVRMVVLTGKGRSFSCGMEVPKVGALLPQGAGALANLDKVTIAAINGDAIDQGLELALACDIRIAIQGAHMGLTHLAQGLVPWDGGTQRLPRIVGRAHALDLLLTGRLLDAPEALGIGLVHRVVESRQLMKVVQEMGGQILKGAPVATAYAREAVYRGMDLTLAEGLRVEADLNLLLHTTRDRVEGIRSFLEERPPLFRGE